MRKYYTHIVLISLGLILYLMANFQRVAIPGAIFDVLQFDLSLKSYQVTVLSSIFMYSYAFGLLFFGVFVDKFGPIKVIMSGSLVFALGSVIFPNTTSQSFLYFSRALLGFGAASFYLSLVHEAKKCFPDKFFGISVSLMLITGYIGGICANAPFITLMKFLSWQKILNILGIITLITSILFCMERKFLNHIPKNEHANFSLHPFKEVLVNKKNHNLYIFACLNYGLYYVIQTVIGVKFLKDFVNMSSTNASVILSIMVVIAGLSGISMATLSVMLNNRRVIFMKTICIMSSVIFAIISCCLILKIKTIIIAGLFLLLALGGGMSPILVPIVHATNKYEIRGTALSVMNSLFFIMVGLLGTLTGFILNIFPAVTDKTGYLIYSEKAYLTIFLMFFVFSLIEMYNVFKLKDV